MRSPALAAPWFAKASASSLPPCPQEGLTRFHQRRFTEVRRFCVSWRIRAHQCCCGLAQVRHASVKEAAVGHERGVSIFFCNPHHKAASSAQRAVCSLSSVPKHPADKLAISGFCSSTSIMVTSHSSEESVWPQKPCQYPKHARYPRPTQVHWVQRSIRVVPIHAARMPSCINVHASSLAKVLAVDNPRMFDEGVLAARIDSVVKIHRIWSTHQVLDSPYKLHGGCLNDAAQFSCRHLES